MRPGRTLDDLRGLRYARWIRESTAGQYDRFGPESQERSIATFVERFGLVDSGITYTVAHSGKTVWRTTEMAALVTDVRARRFDALIVGYFDRWQRNLRRTLELVEDELHPNDVSWVMADRRLVSSDPNDWDEMIREAHEAERYSRKLAERVADGYNAKFHRYADPGGNAPFGFRRATEPPRLLEPDPESIDQAVALFRRYASGATSIRRLAEETGLQPHVVAETLRNPVYNGWVRRHGQERQPARWRADPPVDDRLWDRVAAIREREASFHGGAPARGADLLRHLLRCTCGARITSNGNSHGYRQRMHPRTDCAAWPARIADGRPWERAIAAQVSSIRWDDATCARIVRALTAARPAPIEIAKGAEVRRRRELANALAEGRISESEFLAGIAALRETSAPARTADGVTAAEVAAKLRDTAVLWSHPGVTDARRAELVAAIYEEITVADRAIASVRLTPAANAMGLPLAMRERVQVEMVSPGGLGPTLATIPIEGRAAWIAASRRTA